MLLLTFFVHRHQNVLICCPNSSLGVNPQCLGRFPSSMGLISTCTNFAPFWWYFPSSSSNTTFPEILTSFFFIPRRPSAGSSLLPGFSFLKLLTTFLFQFRFCFLGLSSGDHIKCSMRPTEPSALPQWNYNVCLNSFGHITVIFIHKDNFILILLNFITNRLISNKINNLN